MHCVFGISNQIKYSFIHKKDNPPDTNASGLRRTLLNEITWLLEHHKTMRPARRPSPEYSSAYSFCGNVINYSFTASFIYENSFKLFHKVILISAGVPYTHA